MKIAALSGPAGKGKLQIQAGNKSRNGQDSMPTGIAALQAGAPSATIQVQRWQRYRQGSMPLAFAWPGLPVGV